MGDTAFCVVLEVISLGSPTSLRIPTTSMLGVLMGGVPTVASFSTSFNFPSSTKLNRACGSPTFSLH
jgi:hypothetical protein